MPNIVGFVHPPELFAKFKRIAFSTVKGPAATFSKKNLGVERFQKISKIDIIMPSSLRAAKK